VIAMTKIATASRPMAHVSKKDAVVVFRQINNKSIEKAKMFLNDLINEKVDINGKHYTGATKEILKLVEEIENNAESLGLDKEKLFIKEALANQTFRFMLPKSRWSHRGKKAKLCNLKLTVGER
jgi:ribosomal protein L22